jgi:hypothetical protein
MDFEQKFCRTRTLKKSPGTTEYQYCKTIAYSGFCVSWPGAESSSRCGIG